ncbi:TIR domain-containing protein [Paenibacillus naphthalenovorans]|uniref:TIR domain-containing protein n=1 Tax=Paenibacillus naphthalenovorans TaxID=162209 RepID=UPI00088C12E6|nr:TIR domain-containing protein [Paenibacillus naphthalenovorans]SDJ75954.1 MTH538 TIR-like domain [Paenibacillus naphthalenovorans]
MKTYNIFISHAWKYTEHYNKIVQWLNEAQSEGKFNWKNYSVPVHDPAIDPSTSAGKKKLKEALDAQIKPASIVIILAGMYVAYSEWIDFEIDTAVSYEKYIIGVEPWGQEKVPKKVSENANIMVGWNKKSVIDAVAAR